MLDACSCLAATSPWHGVGCPVEQNHEPLRLLQSVYCTQVAKHGLHVGRRHCRHAGPPRCFTVTLGSVGYDPDLKPQTLSVNLGTQVLPVGWSATPGGAVFVHSPRGSLHWQHAAQHAALVSMSEAEAYCRWTGGGARLMTEAEYQRILDHDQGTRCVHPYTMQPINAKP